MAIRYLNKKTHRFYFVNADGERKSYVLIQGDEVNTRRGNAPSGPDFRRVEYRGRLGEWKLPPLATRRSTEFYFLDVGQGDAAFVVTPNDTKILVDGGLHNRALGFLIWKYRLDQPGNTVTIDHLFLSHGDADHVQGLVPLLNHPAITVRNIHHNGIALFRSGFDTQLGDRSNDGKRLVTIHDTLADLDGLDVNTSGDSTFGDWIDAVRASGAAYGRLDRSQGLFDIGDDAIALEIVSPILEPDGQSLPWFSDKSHTINGNSLAFTLTQGQTKAFFSGDLNTKGSRHVIAAPRGADSVNAHIFKAPHHGSHEFATELFAAVNPMITVVSSGEVPDHGHPRANFLSAIGRASRGDESLLFSTELSALFVDSGDPDAVADHGTNTDIGDLDFSSSSANTEARQRFKKLLSGIINVRIKNDQLFAYRRVQQGYQWESYGPIKRID